MNHGYTPSPYENTIVGTNFLVPSDDRQSQLFPSRRRFKAGFIGWFGNRNVNQYGVVFSPVESAILSKITRYGLVWHVVVSPAECNKLSSPPAPVKDSRSVSKSGGRQHMVLMTAIPVGFSSD